MSHIHSRHPFRCGRLLVPGLCVFAIVGWLAAMAFAAGGPTVSSTSNSKLNEQIVVNAQGRTLYALSPETTHHLLCTSKQCFKFWPPLTVASGSTKLEAGPGVHGHLGIIHRNGIFQVTLRGMPLYRYFIDHSKGQVNGQEVQSFGGTWHAVTVANSPQKGQSKTSQGERAPSTEGQAEKEAREKREKEEKEKYPAGW